jgi:hypothetical protein
MLSFDQVADEIKQVAYGRMSGHESLGLPG